ncbi:oligosaccharide repeat unit polymerase [Fusobacterium varium]|nr:oligosaccharide repeat unit polymerase [Fusobacterium varium]
MIYILFLGILTLFFISFFLFKKNILNPSVILCSSFLCTNFIAILNQKKWKIVYSYETIFLIWLTIIIFIIGNILAYLFLRLLKIKKSKRMNYLIDKNFFNKVMLLNIILIVLLIKYFKDTYKLSLLVGNDKGYDMMLYYVRYAKLNFFSLSKFNLFSFYLAKITSYVCFFIFSYKSIFNKLKFRYFYLLIPTVIYFCFIILTAGRGDFIYLIVYMLCIFSILYLKKKNFKLIANIKILILGIFSILIFFIIFILSGYFTKKSYNRDLLEVISVYAGSSLPALNIFLNSKKIIKNTYFGENTLFLIYNILRKFGYDIPKFYEPYEFVYFGGVSTNIFSAIRRYYEDFGIYGLLLIVLILGFMYSIFFYYASYRNNNFILISYSIYCYPIFDFAIEERFFMTLFPQGIVYNLVTLCIIYYFLNVGRRKLNSDINNRF